MHHVSALPCTTQGFCPPQKAPWPLALSTLIMGLNQCSVTHGILRRQLVLLPYSHPSWVPTCAVWPMGDGQPLAGGGRLRWCQWTREARGGGASLTPSELWILMKAISKMAFAALSLARDSSYSSKCCWEVLLRAFLSPCFILGSPALS